MRFRFSRRAECDIEEIGDYIARDNPMRAVSFIEELRLKCHAFTNHPEGAPIRPEYGHGIRMAIFDPLRNP